MKTMKRLLAFLLALTMVMPNCLTIASAYTEEIAEEVAQELAEETYETPEEVVEEVFEEVYEEELYEEEVQEAEEVAVDDVASVTEAPASAEAEPVVAATIDSCSNPEGADDSEAQFAAYANSVLYPNAPVLLGTDGRDALSGNSLELYDALALAFRDIADGKVESTEIRVGYGSAYMSGELFAGGYTGFDLALVMDALLADMPYALYWYDKVTGTGEGSIMASQDEQGNLYNFFVTIPFAVGPTFRKDGALYMADTAKTGAAKNTADTAKTVAAECVGKSDYETLKSFADWIVDAADYDHDAVKDEDHFSTVDSNPWQLIYVFDGDENTKVVCEGFSKAFQYLCDLAYAEEKLSAVCYSVAGDLYSTADENLGAHMWNIVALDGQRYLVDLTQMNGGWPNAFMVGGTPAGTNEGAAEIDYEGFTTLKYKNPDGLGFEYNQEAVDLYGLSDLYLSGENCPVPEADDEGNGSEGESGTMTQAELLTEMDAVGSGGVYTLTKDVTIGTMYFRDQSLGIGTGCHDVIIDGGSLTVTTLLTLDGTITIRNGGRLIVEEGATFTINQGSVVTVEDDGMLANKGTIYANGIINGPINGDGNLVLPEPGEDQEVIPPAGSDAPDAPNVPEGSMSQEDLMAALAQCEENGQGWVHESDTHVTEDMEINVPFYLDDGGRLFVFAGATLTINAPMDVIGGRIFVEQGAKVILKNHMNIFSGTVFVDNETCNGNPAEFEFDGGGTWGEITWAIPDDGALGTEAYISANWVHDYGNGLFVNNIDYPEHRSLSMPNTTWGLIFYLNEFDWENTNAWIRTPIAIEDLLPGNHLVLTPMSEYDWCSPQEGYEDVFGCFVDIGFDDPDFWDEDTTIQYFYGDGILEFNIRVEREYEHGFYCAPEATNENWLNGYKANPLKSENSFYYIYTASENTVDEVTVEGYLVESYERIEGTNAWKIVLDQEKVNDIWVNHEFDGRVNVIAQVSCGDDSWTVEKDMWVETWWPHEHSSDLSFEMDTEEDDALYNYRYYDGLGWMRYTDNGAEVVDMDALGISYDAQTKTLTFDGVDIDGIHLNGNFEDGINSISLKLVGENRISCDLDFATGLVLRENLTLSIKDGGNGVLNIGHENEDVHIGGIDVNPSSTLNLLGGTINVNNADLHLGGMVYANGATVNVDRGQVHVDRQMKLNAGEVNITAFGHVAPHQDMPDVMHTHYDGITVGEGNTLYINGGALNVTIPEADTPSTWFRGINVAGGKVEINGGTVTLNTPAEVYGHGIHLERGVSELTMNGGKLVMKNDIFPGDYGMANILWSDGNAQVTINGGEMDLDAVAFEVNGKTTWNDGVVNGEEVRILAGGPEFIINGGEFNLTGQPIEGDDEIFSNALFRAYGNVYMNGGTVNIVDGVLGVHTMFDLSGGQVNINNTYDEMEGLFVANYMVINGGELNVSVPGGDYVDENGETVVLPAAWVNGTLHQMGGTVNITSGSTAAIRSEGSVLLNNGTMNLTGAYGIGQLYNEKNPEDMFWVSGGKLNIDATDTGIFAQNSSVRFVPGEDEKGNIISEPTVIINGDAIAIQMISDGEDSGLINEYIFVNADGETLELVTYDRREEEIYQCYVHNLLDGEDYATYAEMKPVTTIASQDDLDAVLAAAEDDYCVTGRNIRITGNVTLSRKLIMDGLCTLTVADGAVLTIPEGGQLSAMQDATILVEDGGQIHNYGILASNHGDISVADPTDGYAHHDGAEVIWHHDYGSYGNIGNISTEYWSIRAVVDNAEQIGMINDMADSGHYADATIEIFDEITLSGPVLETPYEIRVSANAPWYVYNDITLDPGILLTIERGAKLNLWDKKFQVNGILENNGTLDLRAGNPEAASGSLVVGQYGTLTNNGEIKANGANISVNGRMNNRQPLFLVDGAVLTVNRYLMNTAPIHVGFPTETDVPDGGQLNINGTVDNFGYLNVCGDGIVNVDSTLNVDVWQNNNEIRGYVENNGLINVRGAMNIAADGMYQSGTLLVEGMLNIFSYVANVGFLGLQTTENGGGYAEVNPGGSLNVSGVVHVNDGARLINNDADIRIRMGTLYVTDGGEIGPHWDGTITRQSGENEESTENYIGANWLSDEDGWFENVEDDMFRELHMEANSMHLVIFYENIWNEEALCWERNPIPITGTFGNATLKQLVDMEDVNYKDDEDPKKEFFIWLETNDQWDTEQYVTYGDYLGFKVTTGRDQRGGFYSSMDVSNETYLQCVDVDNLAESVQDKTFYFIITEEGWRLNTEAENWLQIEADTDYEITGEYVNDQTVAITVPAEAIRKLSNRFGVRCWFEVINIYDSTERWEYGTEICGTNLDDLAEDVAIQLNNEHTMYNVEHDVWTIWGEHGREIVNLAELGLSYDYENNILTMSDAQLTNLQVGYYGWDEDHLTDEWHDLPSQQMTIELEGENSIVSDTGAALGVYNGVELTITGEGSLYVKTDNGEGFYNADEDNWYHCSAVDVGHEETKLILDGNINVSVEIAGKAYYTDNGEKHDGRVNAINGGGNAALIVTGNAQLTTIVPEGAVHGNDMEDVEFHGGHGGIEGFRSISIEGEACMNTQDLGIGDGSYTQEGGTVNIEAMGHVAPHEETGVAHTHFDAMHADNGTITVEGGILNITIPDAESESTWHRGIALDGGELKLGGDGRINLSSNGSGNGINLERDAKFTMTGGTLYYDGEPWQETNPENGRTYYARAQAIWSNEDAVVNIENGSIEADNAIFEFNGTTHFGTEGDDSNPVFNGHKVQLNAGGAEFFISNGTIELTGGYADENDENSFILGQMYNYGNVVINGGNINLYDGMLAVTNCTELNGGHVCISNSFDRAEGLYVRDYLAINGGELNITTPGGTFVNGNGDTISVPAIWVDGTLHQMGGTIDVNGGTTEAIHNYGSVIVNGGEMTLNGKTAMVSEYSEDGWFFVNQENPEVETAVKLFGEEYGLVASSSVEIFGGRVYASAWGAADEENGFYPAAIKLEGAYDDEGNLIMVPGSDEDPMVHLAVVGAKLQAFCTNGTGILADNAPIIIREGNDGEKPEVVASGSVALRTITTGEDMGLTSVYPFTKMNGDALTMVQVREDDRCINTLMDGENPAKNAKTTYKMTQEDLEEILAENKADGSEYVLNESFTLTGDLTIDTWFTISDNITLTVPEDVTLIITADDFRNYGNLVVDGSLIINGYVTNEGQVSINHYAEGSGTVYNTATFDVNEGATLDFEGLWLGSDPCNNGGTVIGSAFFWNQDKLEAMLAWAKEAGEEIHLDQEITLERDLYLDSSLVIDAEGKLIVPEGVSFTISAEGNLEMKGQLEAGGTLVAAGRLHNEGQIDCYGNLEGDGTIINDATINCYGEMNFGGTWEGNEPNIYNYDGVATDVWMRVDGMDVEYAAAEDLWLTWGEHGRAPVQMPEGFSYDYESNTVTLENAHLSGLAFGYYGWENDQRTDEWHDLPSQNLTLNLVGANTINSTELRDHALKLDRGVKLNITGDGSLYISTDNGEGFYDEHNRWWYSCAPVNLNHEDTELIFSGNAKVTVQASGQGVWSEQDGEKQTGHLGAVQGNGHKLTVTDKAALTTVLPANALKDDRLNGTSGYTGIHGFNITVSGGTVNTQFIGIGSETFTQTGGTVNVTALASLSMEDKYEWNDETQRDEYVGKVEHTHYDGIHTNGGNITITGGALNITIPDNAATDSIHFRGIAMDSGNLTIGGDAVVTIDSPHNYKGHGIALSCAYDENGPVADTKAIFNMTGGKLVVKEEIFDNLDMTNVIWGDGNAEVTIDGGEWDLDAVYVDLNGKTTWNGGVVNGEETVFVAGGPDFVINGGEFNLTGKAIEGNDEVFSNALFRASGMVHMNGGNINIVDGVLGVPTMFELNDGSVTITNTDPNFAELWGLYVHNYMVVNGGTLTVSVPGVTHEEMFDNNPAAMIMGTFHQMGGTVNFSSENTAAIKSFGSVLVNGGEMNLSGSFGIGQFYNEEYVNGKFFMNGGKLNIEAADTGIFANNSPVRIMKGENGVNPSVNIDAGAAAIQILTEGEESGMITDYSFVNEEGQRLVLETRDRRDEEAVGCYVHTLMDGDVYATKAQLTQTQNLSQSDFEAAMQEALDEGHIVYELTCDATITSDLTMPIEVRVMPGAELIVKKGATLTIGENKQFCLTAWGGTITVEAGGRIHNVGAQFTNQGGRINLNHGTDYPAYVEEKGADFLVRPVRDGNGDLFIGTTNGWETKDQTLSVNCEGFEDLSWAIGTSQNLGYGATSIEIWNDLYLNTALTIPENVTVTINSPYSIDGVLNDDGAIRSTLTLGENAILVTAAATTEGAEPGTLFINEGAELVAQSGSVINNYGRMHVGNWQRGWYQNYSGKMTVESGATVNLYGYMAVHMYHGEKESRIPGLMNVYGTVNSFDEGEGGYIDNYGVLNVQNGGVINSGFLFTAGGDTNVLEGGTLVHSHVMNVTGSMNVSGELVNEGEIWVNDELHEEVVATLTVEQTGFVTNNGNIYIADKVVVEGTLDNNGGISMAADIASFTTAGGEVTNSGCITTELNKATIDFTNGNYFQDSVTLEDGSIISGELICDYFADGTAAIVKTSDMSPVTLRYMGTNLQAMEAAKARAETLGCGNYLLAIDQDMEIPAYTNLTVDAGSFLVVAPGKTLTVNGSIVNCGDFYLSRNGKGDGAKLINNESIFNEGTLIVTDVGSLENNGTIENGINGYMDIRCEFDASRGAILADMDEYGMTGTIQGVAQDAITVFSAVRSYSEDPEAHIRNVINNSGDYREVEIYLLTDAVISENLEIPGNVTLYIGGSTGIPGSLQLAANAEMVAAGRLVLNAGSMTVDGRMIAAGVLEAKGGKVTVNGDLINGSSMVFHSGVKLYNNGLIENGDLSFEFKDGAVYIPGENGVLRTAYLDLGDRVHENKIAGIRAEYQTLFHPVREFYSNHDEASIRAMMAAVQTGGYGAGEIYFFDKSVEFTEDTTIPANVTIRAGMNTAEAHLSVASGTKLVVEGSVTVEEGNHSFRNHGTTIVNGTLDNKAALSNDGQLDIRGTVTNDGVVTNRTVVRVYGTLINNGQWEGNLPLNMGGTISGTVFTITEEDFLAGLAAAEKTGTEYVLSVPMVLTRDLSVNGKFTISAGGQLTVEENVTLTVSEKAMLHNCGNLSVKGTVNVVGSVLNDGQIDIYGKMNVDGHLNNQNGMNVHVYNGGTLYADGIWDGDPPVVDAGGTIGGTANFIKQSWLVNQMNACADEGIPMVLGMSFTMQDDLAIAGELIVNEGVDFNIPEDMTLTIPEGATLTINGNLNNYGNLVVNGTLIINKRFDNRGELQINGSMTIGEGGWLYNNGSTTVNGTMTADGSVANNGTVVVNGTLMANNRWIGAEPTGTGTIQGSPFVLNQDKLEEDINESDTNAYALLAKSFELERDLVLDNDETLMIENGGHLIIPAGKTLTIRDSASILVNKDGQITNNGTIVIEGNGVLSNSNIITNNGDVTVSAKLNVNPRGRFENDGTTTILTGGHLEMKGIWNGNDPVLQGGTANGMLLTQEDLEKAMEAGSFTLTKSIALTKDLTIDNELILAEGVELIIPEGISVFVEGQLINKGTIVLKDQMEVNGKLVNQGKLTVEAGAILNLNNVMTNEGLLEIYGFGFVNGVVRNDGYANVYSGGTLMGSGDWNGNKPVVIGDGSVSGKAFEMSHDEFVAGMREANEKGEAFRLTENYTLEKSTTIIGKLMICEGGRLVIPAGKTLTIPEAESGDTGLEILSGGIVTIESGGRINNYGLLANSGGKIESALPNGYVGKTDRAELRTAFTDGKLALVEGIAVTNQTLIASVDSLDLLKEVKSLGSYRKVLATLTDSSELGANFTIQPKMELDLADEAKLTIPEGITLTVNGIVRITSGSTVEIQGKLTNNQTMEIAVGGMLTNSGELENNGKVLFVSELVNREVKTGEYTGDGIMTGNGSYSGHCGYGSLKNGLTLSWNITGRKLAITGQGDMYITPWNMLKGLIPEITEIGLATKLSNILNNAFTDFVGVKSLTIPTMTGTVEDRWADDPALSPFHKDMKLKVPHNGVEEYLILLNEQLDEQDQIAYTLLHTMEGDKCKECTYSLSESVNIVIAEVNAAANTAAQVEAVKNADTETLKTQITNEIKSGDSTNGELIGVITEVDNAAKDSGVSVDVVIGNAAAPAAMDDSGENRFNETFTAATVTSDNIVGAALNAEGNQVTLIISEAAGKVSLGTAYAADTSLAFDMTLEGAVGNHEMVPMVVKLPLPADVTLASSSAGTVKILHYKDGDNAEPQQIDAIVENGYAVFTVDSFSTYVYVVDSAVHIDGSELAMTSMEEILKHVEDGDTIVVTDMPENADVQIGCALTVKVNQNLNYVPAVADGYQLGEGVAEDGCIVYRITTEKVAQFNDTLYETVTDAVTAAAASSVETKVITLLKDVTEDVFVDAPMTILRNGHSVIGTDGETGVTAEDGYALEETTEAYVIYAPVWVGEKPYRTYEDAVAHLEDGDTLILQTVPESDVKITKTVTVQVKTGSSLEQISALCGTGYVAVNTSNGYEIKPAAATVNGVGYGSLNQAVAAANAGQTIAVLADYNGDPIVISKAVTVITNGFAVSFLEAENIGSDTANGQINFFNVVATIGDQKYGTLSAALAAEGEQIVLKSNNGTLTEANRVVTIDTQGYDANVTAGAGFVKVEEGDITRIVKAVARIGTTDFETLVKAIQNAKAGDTIVLLADVDVPVTVSKAVTIDAQNFRMENVEAGGDYVKLVNGSAVTFSKAAAKIGDKKYQSLSAAVSEAADGDRIIVLAKSQETIVVNKAVTIAAGDYTINVAEADDYIMTRNGTVYSFSKAAAKVGTQKYETLSAAIAAAKKDNVAEIELLANCEDAVVVDFLLKIKTNGFTCSKVTAADAYGKSEADGYITFFLAAAKIGDKKYESLQAALQVAKAGDEIDLLADTDDVVVVNVALTIRTNGFTCGAITEGSNTIKTESEDVIRFVQAMAKVGSTKYETVAAAVAAAKKANVTTIDLLATSKETVTVDFAVTINRNGYSVTIKAGTDCKLTTATAKYTVAYNATTVTVSKVASSGAVKISWKKLAYASSYEVLRSTTNKAGSYTKIATTSSTSYTDTSAKAGTTYYYKVRAVNSGAPESSYQKILCALAQPSVTASNTASNGKIKLTWEKVSGVKEYKVYRATSKSGTYKEVKTTTGTSYTDSTASVGKTYYYKVMAIHKTSGANSEYSSVVSRGYCLAQPTSVKAANTDSTGQVKLTWKKVSGAKNYTVYRATSKTGTYTKLKTTSSTSYTDSSATVGKTYYYKVTANHKTSTYNSAYSAIVSESRNLAQPNVTVKLYKGDPKLSWKKITDATKYEIYRATSENGKYTKIAEVSKSKTSYTDTDKKVKSGKTYYYKVKAIKSGANSAYSSVDKIKVK